MSLLLYRLVVDNADDDNDEPEVNQSEDEYEYEYEDEVGVVDGAVQNETQVTTIMNQKGGVNLAHAGYVYSKHSIRSNGEVRWRCVKRLQACGGIIHSNEAFSAVRIVAQHNHPC